MTTANNITDILQPHLKKIEKAYNRVLYFDDIDRQEYVYTVGAGGIVITVSKRDGSLTIQVFEKMPLTNTNGYLTYQGSPQTLGGFAYKAAEEVKEILDELCSILLETPANCIDAKAVKQKVMAAEFACHQKYHPIPEKTMQSMKFEAERVELNMSLKKAKYLSRQKTSPVCRSPALGEVLLVYFVLLGVVWRQ